MLWTSQGQAGLYYGSGIGARSFPSRTHETKKGRLPSICHRVTSVRGFPSSNTSASRRTKSVESGTDFPPRRTLEIAL